MMQWSKQRALLGAFVGAGLALCVPACAAAGGIVPARPGDVAIGQELDAARRAGTAAAYDQFIARHGNHPLARAAREERARLATPGRHRER